MHFYISTSKNIIPFHSQIANRFPNAREIIPSLTGWTKRHKIDKYSRHLKWVQSILSPTCSQRKKEKVGILIACHDTMSSGVCKFCGQKDSYIVHVYFAHSLYGGPSMKIYHGFLHRWCIISHLLSTPLHFERYLLDQNYRLQFYYHNHFGNRIIPHDLTLELTEELEIQKRLEKWTSKVWFENLLVHQD